MSAKYHRVVITGMGVVAPNGHGLNEFENALRNSQSGVEYYELLKELNFSCQVASIPKNIDAIKDSYLDSSALLAMNSSMIYAAIAVIDCWRDAGFHFSKGNHPDIDWDTGAMIGTGISAADLLCKKVGPFINEGRVRRLGSTMVEQTMASASSANIGGLIGLGGQVTTNSSACTTGTEALANAFFTVREGRLKRVLTGATEDSSHYIWGCFDAMKVLARGFNDNPQGASRPMSATACGFVPAAGAGVLMVESLDSALERNAKIYAEIIGAHVNCGGQRNGGSITAPNPEGVQRCIKSAMHMAEISASDIDLINGHLTATMGDVLEIENWKIALGCEPEEFPLINSTKSLIGHALGAAGGIEAVASVLQLHKGFVHGSINCEDLHPKLASIASSVVHKSQNKDLDIVAKASFGFGDVNGCLLFKKYK